MMDDYGFLVNPKPNENTKRMVCAGNGRFSGAVLRVTA